MKRLVLGILTTAIIFISCSKEKNENDEKLCPVIEESLVPQIVKDSFAIRYPGTSVTTWFNKDSIGYCSFFTISGVDKLAEFALNGSFVKDEIETEQDGEHQDSTSTGVKTTGCVCEIHNGD